MSNISKIDVMTVSASQGISASSRSHDFTTDMKMELGRASGANYCSADRPTECNSKQHV